MSKCTYLVKDPSEAVIVIDRDGSKTYEKVQLPAKYCERTGVMLFTHPLTGEKVTLCKTHLTDAALAVANERGYESMEI